MELSFPNGEINEQTDHEENVEVISRVTAHEPKDESRSEQVSEPDQSHQSTIIGRSSSTFKKGS